VKINDVISSAKNEAALAADSHFIVECISSTEWILRGFTKRGADLAAIVPNAR
jgi:DNA-directed RNA polymerase specialized sigma54-like protein